MDSPEHSRKIKHVFIDLMVVGVAFPTIMIDIIGDYNDGQLTVIIV